MHTLLVTNIAQLVNVRTDSKLLRGRELSVLPSIHHAYLLIQDNEIAEFGEMADMPAAYDSIEDRMDAANQFVLPAWCDSHTHLVFAGSREMEMVDKIKGLSYAEINAKGGGILHSADRLNSLSEGELFELAWKRLQEAALQGTGAIEIKSGYGLSVEGELKMLRVIKKLKEKSSLIIKSTLLAAHTYPLAFREDHLGYISQIINEILPVVARERLADYIDVFCDSGFFSPSEMETICLAGKEFGLKPKLHVNQLSSIGGIGAGIGLNAVSLDHLETMTESDIQQISQADTIGTMLPTAAFFLRMPFQPARRLIDSGAAVALASDYNPGSSPSCNMNFVVSLSCIQMRMLPEEAINAATLNGAFAMEVDKIAGSITRGKRANLIFTKPMPSIAYLPYSFGTNLVDKVMLNGSFI